MVLAEAAVEAGKIAVQNACSLGVGWFRDVWNFDDNSETLKSNLETLIATAADVEEDLRNLELSGNKKRKQVVVKWLEKVVFTEGKVVELNRQVESRRFNMRYFHGGDVPERNKKVEKLLLQRSSFGELVLDDLGPRGKTFQVAEMVGNALKQKFETILEHLKDEEVSKIGVYGMGGVGKTTLVKHINNRLVQECEGLVFWVTVSHELTIKSLQDKIATCVGVDLPDEDTEDRRASRLRTALSATRNSVLILDDVWGYIDMAEVGCDLEGCRLIITTRSVAVCQGIGCQKEIPVEKLNEDEAWKLFKKTLGVEIELDRQVEGIAKSMVKLCGGLPLAIIPVARSMKGRRGSHRWTTEFLELKKRVKGQGTVKKEVFEVLKFSFDRLKEENDNSNEFNMKQLCFLYCSLYPEDYHIDRDDLVGKFISEGMLDESRSRRERADQGHSILDELVDVCLLETCVDLWNRECVKMHDLVRGMALKICEGKYMARAGDMSLKEIPNEEWTQGLEKVSFMLYDIRRIGEGISPDCPNLSTLLLLRNIRLSVIPDSFFSKMHGLCTLNMGANLQIAMLPDSISDLTCLKSLQLEGCSKLKKVPYLGKLKALRELNLSKTAIEEVPAGLEELVNLRFLSVNSASLNSFPEGLLLKLMHLQHLNLPLYIQVEIEEIEKLGELEEFGGGVKSVSDFNRFIASHGVQDPCYRIGVNSNRSPVSIFTSREDIRIKNNLLVLPKIKLNEEKVLAKCVVDLRISNCEGLSKWFVDDLSQRFDNPTSLKKLKISYSRGIEWIMRSDGQGLSNTLQQIELWELDDLKGVMERGEISIPIGAAASTMQPPAGVFSSLKSLNIYYCKRISKMGLAASVVPNLEVINIVSCGEIQEIFEEDDDGGIAATSILSTSLPKLSELTLSDLPRLKRVSKATIISNSIGYISITRCPELINKLPLHFGDPAPPPSLYYIRVEREWWESLEWDSPLLPQLLQPFLYNKDEAEVDKDEVEDRDE